MLPTEINKTRKGGESPGNIPFQDKEKQGFFLGLPKPLVPPNDLVLDCRITKVWSSGPNGF